MRIRASRLRPVGRLTTRRRLGAAVAVVVVGWVGYAVASETATGHALDARVRALKQENAQLEREINARRAEISAAANPAWLEEQARRLGYVRPGERVFVLASPRAGLLPDGGVDVGTLPSFAPPVTPGSRPAPTPAPPEVLADPSPTPVFLSVSAATPTPH